jgi:hypothetical protein
MKWILLVALIFCFAACNSEQKTNNKESVDVPVLAIPEPGLVTADSVEVLYFKKPFTDKERYTRFFSTIVTKDTGLIRSLTSILVLQGVKEDSLRACMSEGKFNIPLKGDAYQVVYFSREVKPCSYLYVIRDGQFYYYQLDEHLRQKLNELEKQAKGQ